MTTPSERVAIRQAVILAHPNADEAHVNQLVGRIVAEQSNADLAELKAVVQGEFDAAQAVRQTERQAEEAAFWERVRTPMTVEERATKILRDAGVTK
jgi:hypothetical protein